MLQFDLRFEYVYKTSLILPIERAEAKKLKYGFRSLVIY